MNSNVVERQKLVHTHRTSCRHDWPRGFGALNSSLHSWIFTSVLVGSNPRSHLSTSATVWIPVYTAPKSDTEPIRYVTLHFRDRCGAASLRHKNWPATTFSCVKRRPIRYDLLKLSAIGESLLTSLFTFFLISIRLNSQKPWPYIWTKCKSWKSWLSWAICAIFSSLQAILKEISAIKNCEIAVWQKS